jgi:hypothetical protein
LYGRRCGVAFRGEGAKNGRGKSKVGEIGQSGNSLSVLECRQYVRVNAVRGVGRRPARSGLSRCRQGIKTGPDSTAAVVHSRRAGHVSTPEHEHCILNMLTDTPGIKCRAADPAGSASGLGYERRSEIASSPRSSSP